MLYVIVELDDSEFATKICKSSVGPPPHDPGSFEEAALQQIPEIEVALWQAAFLFAKCGITHNWDEACRLFKQIGIEEAAILAERGPKGQYFSVTYVNENDPF